MNDDQLVKEYRRKKARQIVQGLYIKNRRDLVRECVQNIFSQNPYKKKRKFFMIEFRRNSNAEWEQGFAAIWPPLSNAARMWVTDLNGKLRLVLPCNVREKKELDPKEFHDMMINLKSPKQNASY